MRLRGITIPILAALAFLAVAGQAGAQPCLIFVHGKQTNTNTYTNTIASASHFAHP